METGLVEVGKGVLNLSAVAEAHMEGQKLYVHFVGGAFEKYDGEDARELYAAISERAVKLVVRSPGCAV